MENIKGLIAAVFTPFNSDFSINYQMIPKQIAYLQSTGVIGALVCGTTGEGYSMSVEERKNVAEAWSKHLPEDFLLFVHVGHDAIPEGRELAQHAAKLNASGILLNAPNYYKPEDIPTLLKFHYEIVKDLPDNPVYYYHIPSLNGSYFPMHGYLEQVGQYLKNFKGIKFTYEDFEDLEKCINYQQGKYEIIFGRDEHLLESLKLGITSALGSTYNFMAPLYYEIINHFANEDLESAEALQKEAQKIINIMIRNGGSVKGGKAMMKQIGLDCGPPRLPINELSEGKFNSLKEELNNTEFFEHVSNEFLII